MDRNKIIDMALDAGADCVIPSTPEFDTEYVMSESGIERFAAAIRAATKEEDARICEEISLQANAAWKLAYQPQDQGREMGADDCEHAIRASK